MKMKRVNDLLLREQLLKSLSRLSTLETEYELSKFTILDYLYLHESELNKRLDVFELIQLKRNISEMLNDNVSDSWKLELERVLDRTRLRHIDVIIIYTIHEIQKLAYLEKEILDELSVDIINDSHEKVLYELSIETGYTKIFEDISEEEICDILAQGWIGDYSTYAERLENHVRASEKKILEFTKASKTDDAVDLIVIGIDSIFKTKKQKGKALVVTETVYFNSVGVEEGYNDFEVERFQNIATLDDRTSDICIDMDLTIFKMSEYEIGETAPPFHPYCRTVTIPYFSDNWTTRVAKSDKWYHIDKDISYVDWKRGYMKVS